ncbi:uncharacterized protein LOC143144944 [Ptiloglossa arizonensis]|uniref:uncharacterized protein LOC143144944 n=1 Tax=Ptiloglossa arizonensis TaxID=3350558 RepID=UPI003F9F353D
MNVARKYNEVACFAKLLIVIEEPDTPLLSILNEAAPQAEKKFGDEVITVHISTVTVDRANVIASFDKVCAALFKGISIVLDLTWTGWEKLRNVADENGIIYKRGDCQINSYVQAIDDLLMLKNATDVGLIFEDERELNQSLYYLIGNSIVRLVVIDEFTEKTVSKIRSMRPSPSYYAIYASTSRMEDLFRTVIHENREILFHRSEELYSMIVFSYFLSEEYEYEDTYLSSRSNCLLRLEFTFDRKSLQKETRKCAISSIKPTTKKYFSSRCNCSSRLPLVHPVQVSHIPQTRRLLSNNARSTFLEKPNARKLCRPFKGVWSREMGSGTWCSPTTTTKTSSTSTAICN